MVEELGYAPDGSGEHLFVEIEKRGENTLDVAAELARRAGIRPRDVGFAGLKDRNAVTRQYFSLHLPGREDPPVEQWQRPGIEVLSTKRHSRKIQRGRLRGNRFELVVRELEAEREALEDRLGKVARHGVPNRFGEQRFGGNNVARAYRLFRGELRRAPSKRKRGFYLSAARSLIFNRLLDVRIAEGTWNRAMDGEIVMLDGTRSTFAAEAGDPDIRRRVAEQDLHPTGPLVGEGGEAPTDEAGRLEAKVIEAHAELAEGLRRFRLSADRRPLRMRVLDLEWRFESDDVLVLSFALRSGCYATTVLRELVEYTEGSERDETPEE